MCPLYTCWVATLQSGKTGTLRASSTQHEQRIICESHALCFLCLMLLRHIYAEHWVARSMSFHDWEVIVLLG